MSRALGRNLRELLATTSAAELALWEAEYGIEPWGELRGDLQMARQCAAAVAPWSKRRVNAADFLFEFGTEREAGPLDLLEQAKAYHLGYGALASGH